MCNIKSSKNKFLERKYILDLNRTKKIDKKYLFF